MNKSEDGPRMVRPWSDDRQGWSGVKATKPGGAAGDGKADTNGHKRTQTDTSGRKNGFPENSLILEGVEPIKKDCYGKVQ